MRRLASCAVLLVLVGCRDKKNELGLQIASAITGQNPIPSGLPSSAAAFEGTTTGTVHSAGGDLGDWDITLTRCETGEYNGFYGADFFVKEGGDLRLRYVHDEAAGDVVKVLMPGKKGEAMVFDRNAKCSVLEGHVEKTNVKTWTPKGDMRHVNGAVKFDCTQRSGTGHVNGSVTFEHCH